LAARIELAASLPEVGRLNDWLAGVLAGDGLSPAAADACKLCLNELVANTVLYGYPDGKEGRIVVSVDRQGEAFAVLLEDDGIAFDPLSAPEARPMQGLEDARIGGFGIKLFRESSREARYERSGGRNRLSFVCG
jgi:serine/threonine-protein kinase RsbW